MAEKYYVHEFSWELGKEGSAPAVITARFPGMERSEWRMVEDDYFAAFGALIAKWNEVMDAKKDDG